MRRGLTLAEARALQEQASREGFFLPIYEDSGSTRKPRRKKGGDGQPAS